MKRGTVALGACAAASLTAGLVAAFFLSPFAVSEAKPLLTWDDAPTVARGRALYAGHCAGCHGAGGEGQMIRGPGVPMSTPLAPPHDASGHTWQHPDFALFQLTKNGLSTVACRPLDENAMPRFDEALSDQQILDVLAFIKSRWPADIRNQQDRTNSLYAVQNQATAELEHRTQRRNRL